ncbi:MAG: hypothetical protein MJ180_04985 [Candidatus Gastranaerophilales bacterium]|nr:hypothetical protein [Candidatus Gastranaerophilales bacterium]
MRLGEIIKKYKPKNLSFIKRKNYKYSTSIQISSDNQKERELVLAK